ncbi:uncharacterized protein N7483_000482 [Penicillium malachiteum]|uniref:uncharacterized protein n=1 Tax=Penicillium malachiteum TaxID=1324776 RepID=UPI0025498AB3|nr:uncharacterized protein N7483_000482 [Penicillium malachiteum]KAJ5735357.1 hypothetical protein N7483_000482 [Penicillium malachiteum]
MEDSINKPWRTMPAKRMSQDQATGLMYLFYALAVYTSSRVGGLGQCLTLIFLGYWYNIGGGGDTSSVVRNFINGLGFICYTSGALQLELSPSEWQLFIDPNEVGLQWLGIIGAIVFTTVQLQDFYDQAGDSARDRKTLPLVIGDKPARYITAACMVIWGLFTPWYWGFASGGMSFAVLRGFAMYLAALAWIISVRILIFRSVRADRLTFVLWNVWLVSQYALPLCAKLSQTRPGKAC